MSLTCDSALLNVHEKVTNFGSELTEQGSVRGSPRAACTTRGVDHEHMGGSVGKYREDGNIRRM